MTIKEFKLKSINELKTSLSPSLDVEILLCHYLNLDKTHLLLNQNQIIPQDKLEQLEQSIKKRQTGLPIAYITNHKEFYGYDFYVTPDVLIPKPDTEILVEKAVLFLEEKINANPDRILMVCDMCTGSGCIGISVLKSLYQDKRIPFDRLPKFTLVDISINAIEIAKKNADKILTKNENAQNTPVTFDSQSIPVTIDSISMRQKIHFIQSNLFEMVPYQFDAVLTNPPYVPSALTDQLLKDGRNEPRLALDGDICANGDRDASTDGLSIIRRLLPQIAEHTTPAGFFLMETGEYNMKGAENLSYRAGFRGSQIFLDLEGQERVLFAHK